MPSLSDGYVGLFLVPDEGVPVAVISNAGSISVTEEVSRVGNNIISSANIAITGVQISTGGAVENISVEMKKSDQPAINYCEIKSQPSNTQTLTVGKSGGSIVYTFKTSVSSANDIKIGATLKETVLNIIKTINQGYINGVNGTGTQAHIQIIAKLKQGYVITLIAKNTDASSTKGADGNSLALSTTSSAILPHSATFFGGTNKETDTNYNLVARVKATQSDGSPNWSGTANNSATIKILSIPYSDIGIAYEFRIKLYNADGQIAVNTNGSQFTIEKIASFNGITDLSEYAEVTQLKVINASNPEGDESSPASLPPGGVARLQWNNMANYTSLPNHPISAPSTAGSGLTQSTANINATQLAQITEYVVYMFISTAGLAPVHKWVRPVDANGAWYLVCRTSNTYAEIKCPINKKIAFWVGFGTSGTNESSVIPDQQLTYLES